MASERRGREQTSITGPKMAMGRKRERKKEFSETIFREKEYSRNSWII
jgi:hypothetical protein